MFATLIASGTGDVGDRASSIHNEGKLLRRRSDPEPRRVISVEEEVVEEAHASVGADFGAESLEVATKIRRRRRRHFGRIGRGLVERQEEGGAGVGVGVRWPEEERGGGGGGASESEEEEEEDWEGGGDELNRRHRR